MKNIALAQLATPLSTSAAVRREFPVLARMVHGKPLCYLDNGASAQRPRGGDRRRSTTTSGIITPTSIAACIP